MSHDYVHIMEEQIGDDWDTVVDTIIDRHEKFGYYTNACDAYNGHYHRYQAHTIDLHFWPNVLLVDGVLGEWGSDRLSVPPDRAVGRQRRLDDRRRLAEVAVRRVRRRRRGGRGLGTWRGARFGRRRGGGRRGRLGRGRRVLALTRRRTARQARRDCAPDTRQHRPSVHPLHFIGAPTRQTIKPARSVSPRIRLP